MTFGKENLLKKRAQCTTKIGEILQLSTFFLIQQGAHPEYNPLPPLIKAHQIYQVCETTSSLQKCHFDFRNFA